MSQKPKTLGVHQKAYRALVDRTRDELAEAERLMKQRRADLEALCALCPHLWYGDYRTETDADGFSRVYGNTSAYRSRCCALCGRYEVIHRDWKAEDLMDDNPRLVVSYGSEEISRKAYTGVPTHGRIAPRSAIGEEEEESDAWSG